MANPIVRVNQGVRRRGGMIARQRSTSAATGGLIRATNARYLPGDPDTLWGLLGRAAFNANPIPVASVQPPDHAIVKKIFPIFHDDGTMKLVLHMGGALYEADLDAAGEFEEEAIVASSSLDNTPAGEVVAYREEGDDGRGDMWLYMIGDTGRGAYSAWSRTADGIWHRAGHQPPVEVFIVAASGGDTFSTTEVHYTCRLYDSFSDEESSHGPVVVLAAASGGTVTLTFPAGVTKPLGNSQEKGTHLRIYRTLRDEVAGVYYRVDGDDEGIALADITAGYVFTDSTSNEDSQTNGRVRADGIEGEIAWAEHGGPIPPGDGVTVFQEHTLVWGVDGFEDRVFASAQGHPEQFPVDFEGEYAYFIPFRSKKRDRVLKVVPMGPSLAIVAGETAIFRLRHVPTYTDPGFDRNVLELITDEHGVCGKKAIAPFGLNAKQAQGVIYVSREFGVMITDGLGCDQIIPEMDFHSLIEPTRWEAVEVVDYPLYQEVWIYYTPRGGSSNTEAICLDYSMVQEEKGWFRVTWPIEVKEVSSCFAFGSDGIGRLYIADASGNVFVQDSGTTDAQKIVNAQGHLRFRWYTERYALAGQGVPVHIYRGFAYGRSGIERTFTLRHYALDGSEEWDSTDKVTFGGNASEGSDTFWCNQAGQAFRVELEFTGETGSSYEDGADQAPGLLELEFEPIASAKQGRTRLV